MPAFTSHPMANARVENPISPHLSYISIQIPLPIQSRMTHRQIVLAISIYIHNRKYKYFSEIVPTLSYETSAKA